MNDSSFSNFQSIGSQSEFIRGKEVVVTYLYKRIDIPEVIITQTPAISPSTDLTFSYKDIDAIVFHSFYVSPKDMTLVDGYVVNYTEAMSTDFNFAIVKYEEGEADIDDPVPGNYIWQGHNMATGIITNSDLYKTVQIDLVETIDDGNEADSLFYTTRVVRKGERVGLIPYGTDPTTTTDINRIAVTLLFKEL